MVGSFKAQSHTEALELSHLYVHVCVSQYRVEWGNGIPMEREVDMSRYVCEWDAWPLTHTVMPCTVRVRSDEPLATEA